MISCFLHLPIRNKYEKPNHFEITNIFLEFENKMLWISHKYLAGHN